MLRHVHGNEAFESALRRDEARRVPGGVQGGAGGGGGLLQGGFSMPSSSVVPSSSSSFARAQPGSVADGQRISHAPADIASVLGSFRGSQEGEARGAGAKRGWDAVTSSGAAANAHASSRQRVTQPPAISAPPDSSTRLAPIRTPGFSGDSSFGSAPAQGFEPASLHLGGLQEIPAMTPFYRLRSGEVCPFSQWLQVMLHWCHR